MFQMASKIIFPPLLVNVNTPSVSFLSRAFAASECGEQTIYSNLKSPRGLQYPQDSGFFHSSCWLSMFSSNGQNMGCSG